MFSLDRIFTPFAYFIEALFEVMSTPMFLTIGIYFLSMVMFLMIVAFAYEGIITVLRNRNQ